MNQILILDTPLIAIWIYPERKIVHHEMKAYCHGADLRDALNKVADAMVRYRATKYLADNRASGAVVREDEEWGTKVWLPRVIAAGWKHWAIVQPASVIGQLNMKRHAATSQTNLGVNTRVFADPDEAMKWLEEL